MELLKWWCTKDHFFFIWSHNNRYDDDNNDLFDFNFIYVYVSCYTCLPSCRYCCLARASACVFFDDEYIFYFIEKLYATRTCCTHDMLGIDAYNVYFIVICTRPRLKAVSAASCGVLRCYYFNIIVGGEYMYLFRQRIRGVWGTLCSRIVFKNDKIYYSIRIFVRRFTDTLHLGYQTFRITHRDLNQHVLWHKVCTLMIKVCCLKF